MNGMDERHGPQTWGRRGRRGGAVLDTQKTRNTTHCIYFARTVCPGWGHRHFFSALCSLNSVPFHRFSSPSPFFSLLLPSLLFFLFITPLLKTKTKNLKNLLPLRNLPFVENEHREERGKRVRRCHARERRNKAHQIGEKGD